MANGTPFRRRVWVDRTENLLVSGAAVGLAVVAIAAFFALGGSVIVVLGVGLAIAQFLPHIYERYWSSAHSPGYRVGWTVLMGLVTMALFLGVYEVLRPFVSDLYAGIVAIVVAPVG